MAKRRDYDTKARQIAREVVRKALPIFKRHAEKIKKCEETTGHRNQSYMSGLNYTRNSVLTVCRDCGALIHRTLNQRELDDMQRILDTIYS